MNQSSFEFKFDDTRLSSFFEWGQSYFYIMRKVWHHQIWIQSYLGFIELTLTKTPNNLNLLYWVSSLATSKSKLFNFIPLTAIDWQDLWLVKNYWLMIFFSIHGHLGELFLKSISDGRYQNSCQNWCQLWLHSMMSTFPTSSSTIDVNCIPMH